jgi:hypothetical protein
MPRKTTKTAPEPSKAPDQGVDTIRAAEAAVEPEKKKTGRPSKYTPEIAQKMCEMLADGIPLREICRQDGFPAWQTVYDWMYRDDALGDAGVGLSRAIARAREVGYEALAEECLRIADNPQWGQKQIMTDQGTSTTVEDMLGHRKLQIETRLKLLAKWNPKKYGDRVALAGDAENPLKVEADVTIFDALIQNLEAKRQTKSHG